MTSAWGVGAPPEPPAHPNLPPCQPGHRDPSPPPPGGGHPVSCPGPPSQCPPKLCVVERGCRAGMGVAAWGQQHPFLCGSPGACGSSPTTQRRPRPRRSHARFWMLLPLTSGGERPNVSLKPPNLRPKRISYNHWRKGGPGHTQEKARKGRSRTTAEWRPLAVSS